MRDPLRIVKGIFAKPEFVGRSIAVSQLSRSLTK